MTASHCACASGSRKMGTRDGHSHCFREAIITYPTASGCPRLHNEASPKALRSGTIRLAPPRGQCATPRWVHWDGWDHWDAPPRRRRQRFAPRPTSPMPRPTLPVAPPAPSRPASMHHALAPETFVVPVRPARPSGPSGPSPTQKRSPRRMPGGSLLIKSVEKGKGPVSS